MRLSLFKKIFLSQLALLIFASGVVSLAGYFLMAQLYSLHQNETLRIFSSSTAGEIAARIVRHRAALKETAEIGEIPLPAKENQGPIPADIHGEEAPDSLAGPEMLQALLPALTQPAFAEVALNPLQQARALLSVYTQSDYFDEQFLGPLLWQKPQTKVVAPDGRILLDSEPKNIGKQLVLGNQDLARLFAKAQAEPGGRLKHALLNGEDCYFAVSLIPDTPWLAMSVLPARQYTVVPRLLRNFSLLLFFAPLLLGGIVSFFLTRGITAPVRKLVQAGAAMAKGNFALRASAGKDETGALAEAFNTLAGKLWAARNREKQLLAAEKSARLMAGLADRHKTEFLAKINHELRTPLNFVLGLADRLAEGEPAGQPRPEIAPLREAGRNLGRLIDAVLDFSRLENSALSLAPAPFDLYAILGRLKRKYEPAAKAKGLTILDAEPEAVPTKVVGDEARIVQVLENLLDNAIKFTEHGNISLRVRPLGLKASNDQHIIHLRFEVADTGCGIAPEQQAAMFEPFAQAEAFAPGSAGGLGIGLALCRLLVELMQGKIGLKSEPGQGSTFFVELDLPVAKE